MWLLDVRTRKLVHFMNDRDAIGKYAILSHTWGNEEVTFSDISRPEASQMKGWQKIDYTCRQAEFDGLKYAWIDTCCIDKKSSAELSEAINSMFRWYQYARVCYAYLADYVMELELDQPLATFRKPVSAPRSRTRGTRTIRASDSRLVASLEDCRWFQRGWTLQELLAPHEIVFFDVDWTGIGTKAVLRSRLSLITGIDQYALLSCDHITYFTIAARLSWASKRVTTRVEDQAYSLLGVCGVNMPLLYGEGANALIRLQEAILNTSLDQSVLAWHPSAPWHRNMLLADDIYCFRYGAQLSGNVDLCEDQDHDFVPKGLRLRLPVLRSPNYVVALGSLNATKGSNSKVETLELRKISRNDASEAGSTRPTTYEVVRSLRPDSTEATEVFRDIYGRYKSQLEDVVVSRDGASATVCIDIDLIWETISFGEASPPECWVADSNELSFTPTKQHPRSPEFAIDGHVTLHCGTETMTLWIKHTSRPFQENSLCLAFTPGTDKLIITPVSSHVVYTLPIREFNLHARSWSPAQCKLLPPRVWAVKLWFQSNGLEEKISMRQAIPSLSLLSRWGVTSNPHDEFLDRVVREQDTVVGSSHTPVLLDMHLPIQKDMSPSVRHDRSTILAEAMGLSNETGDDDDGSSIRTELSFEEERSDIQELLRSSRRAIQEE